MALLVATVGFLLAGAGGAAFAVSGGGYSPYQQGCQPGDDDYAMPINQTVPGCHNTALNVESGGTTQGDPSNTNTKYVQVGVDQSPNDPNSTGTPTPYSIGEPGTSGSPHALCVSANTAGTANCGDNPNGAGFASNIDYYQYYCPVAAILDHPCEAASYGSTTLTGDRGNAVAYQPILRDGVLVYYGMDDNSDNGEHDGLGPYSTPTGWKDNGAVNGPSDGGAILLVLSPMKATSTPSQTHPDGAANASGGFCADGICADATTQQQTVYHGCGANPHVQCDKGTPQNANVYDYAPGGKPGNDPSVNSESANCNSGDASTTSEQACGSGGMDGWRSATPADENTEPGVQVYSDPDPQRSPAAPSPFWPTPALYAGTCGVYAGSPATTGQVLGASATPVSNQAGQVAVDPNPSAC